MEKETVFNGITLSTLYSADISDQSCEWQVKGEVGTF